MALKVAPKVPKRLLKCNLNVAQGHQNMGKKVIGYESNAAICILAVLCSVFCEWNQIGVQASWVRILLSPKGGPSSKLYIYIPVVTRGTGKRRRVLEWMVDNRLMIGNVIRICKH